MSGDPIASIVHALQHDGRVPLAWVVEWTERAREMGLADPVAAAWTCAIEPRACVDLLRATDLVRYRAATSAWANEMDDREERGESLSWYASREAVLAAVRRAVPVPPTLNECMAAAERLQRGDPAPEVMPHRATGAQLDEIGTLNGVAR